MPRSSRSHAGLLVGIACLALAVGPLLVFVLLQSLLGMFPGSSGLGLGLWCAVATPVAAIVLAIGAIRDSRRNRSQNP